MIENRRPDTLTPRVKEIKDFDAALPALLAAAVTRDPQLAQLVRQALWQIHHYHCPIGQRIGDTWVFVMGRKLDTPNKYKAHWSLQQSDRAQWERQLQACILKALGVASWEWLKHLHQVPATTQKMTLQIIRLVKSTREFIRDDENLAFSRKGSTDAMKRCGLLKDDRREWLEALPIYQDVAPNGHPLTVFFLWPTQPGLLSTTSPKEP
jgi:hypothetical protein